MHRLSFQIATLASRGSVRYYLATVGRIYQASFVDVVLGSVMTISRAACPSRQVGEWTGGGLYSNCAAGGAMV